MSRSFVISVQTTPTLLVPPDWVNPIALPYTTQTASFSLTAAMLGLTVQYNSASAGTVTIPDNLTTKIGASVLLGQAGTGALTVAGASGVTITGPCPLTYGQNHVIQAVQTALNVWTVSTYSWMLWKFLGNPNGQPLLVAYESITFTNDSGASILIDTNPNIAWGGEGIELTSTAQSPGPDYVRNYRNGPAELWYGITQSAASALSVLTGPVQ